MTIDQAIDGLKPLGVVRGFPADPKMIRVIAGVVIDWCVGERVRYDGRKYGPQQQLELLVKIAIRQIEFWHGPVQLKEIMADLFPPQRLPE